MMSNRCHICYQILNTKDDYHHACLKKLFNSIDPIIVDFKENDIEKLAYEYVSQKMALPGVQKKLSLTLVKSEENEYRFNRLTIVGYLGGEYILKPPAKEFPFMPEIEDLTMHLASIAKINVALHGLIKMSNGKLAYVTKRFDRVNKRKIAVEDFCQLSNKFTEDKYKSSSERVGQLIRYYSSVPGDDCLKFFELILFCFIVGNADMHLKNFSLITQDLNNIRLAPNYDLLSTRLLIPKHQDPEELALPLNGKKSNIKRKDFEAFGRNLQIPDKVIHNSISLMTENWDNWKKMIDNSFLNNELRNQFQELIQERIAKLA